MEKLGHIAEDKLDFLENILQQVCPLLADKIRKSKKDDCKLQKIKLQLNKTQLHHIYLLL